MEEEYVNLINRIKENIEDCLKTYKAKKEPTKYDNGWAEGIYEMADTIRNQMIVDGITVGEELNKKIDELEKIIK